MEIDTGLSNSIISCYTLNKLVPNISKRSLSHCSIQLQDYQGNAILVLGKGDFQVESPNFTGKLPIIIVEGTLPSLLGLDWFQSLGLSVSGIHSTSYDDFSEFLMCLMAHWVNMWAAPFLSASTLWLPQST